MLHKTKGIALKAIKYGETSLICTVFTHQFGIQSYMVQGVRSAKVSKNRASSFQTGTLLDLVVYLNPQKNLQRISELQVAYIYTGLQESIVKNSIVLFSADILIRLLPEHAPLPGLFEFAFSYFVALDQLSQHDVANFPLYFIINCSRELGYELRGDYSPETPHLDLHEGGFSEHPPSTPPYTSNEDAIIMNRLIMAKDYDELRLVAINADIRLRLLDWFIAFLQRHTQHMGNIKSLAVLRTVLH